MDTIDSSITQIENLTSKAYELGTDLCAKVSVSDSHFTRWFMDY